MCNIYYFNVLLGKIEDLMYSVMLNAILKYLYKKIKIKIKSRF